MEQHLRAPKIVFNIVIAVGHCQGQKHQSLARCFAYGNRDRQEIWFVLSSISLYPENVQSKRGKSKFYEI